MFLFFGIVAVAGSFFVQVGDVDWESFALAVPVGLIAAAILVVNNTRDVDTDRRAGKRTLAVRMGRERSRAFYAGIVLLAYVLVPVTWVFGPLTAWLLLSWLSLPLAIKVIGIVRKHSDGPSLNVALARTGQLQLCFCVLLSAGSAAEPMRVGVAALTVPWRAPLLTAHAADADAPRPLVLLTLTGEDGVCGYGEAAPLERYDGASVQAVQAALARCGPALAASDGSDRELLLRSCEALAELPETLAAIDMALWDLAGRRAGEPVWKLLGAIGAPGIAVNATIGAERPSQAAVESSAAAAAGFDCVKVKVGNDEDDLRLAAVRAAVGAQALIRVDANGAWSVPRAVDRLAVLRVHELELCEEPVHGLDGLDAVSAAAGVPVAADESAREPEVFSRRVCDAVCLKIARCGGISGLRARRCRGTGSRIRGLRLLDARRPARDRRRAARQLRWSRPTVTVVWRRWGGSIARTRCPPAPGSCPHPPAPGWETASSIGTEPD